MSKRKETRHFHAGKQRKVVDGEEFVEVAESKGMLFVSRGGRMLTPRHTRPWLGCVDKSTGYIKISVGNRSAYAHRVVYEVFIAEIPGDKEIDHINANRTDNRLGNLRVVTQRENMVNPITLERRAAALVRLIAGARRAWVEKREKMLEHALRNMRKAQEKWLTHPEQMREYLQRAINGNKVAVVGFNVHTGEPVGPFTTLTEASQATGTHISDISSNVHGRIKSAGGFIWKEVDHVL